MYGVVYLFYQKKKLRSVIEYFILLYSILYVNVCDSNLYLN